MQAACVDHTRHRVWPLALYIKLQKSVSLAPTDDVLCTDVRSSRVVAMLQIPKKPKLPDLFAVLRSDQMRSDVMSAAAMGKYSSVVRLHSGDELSMLVDGETGCRFIQLFQHGKFAGHVSHVGVGKSKESLFTKVLFELGHGRNISLRSIQANFTTVIV